MIFKHLSAFNSTLSSFNISRIVRRCHGDVRKVTIGNVSYEKVEKGGNPEYVPKKFSKKFDNIFRILLKMAIFS